jgi:hypothetical protein
VVTFKQLANIEKVMVFQENRPKPLIMKWSERQDLNLSNGIDNQGVTTSDTAGDTQTAVTSLHDLSQVVQAWPRLSTPIKRAILAIIDTAGT